MNAFEDEIDRISCSHWGMWPGEQPESRAPGDTLPVDAQSKASEARELTQDDIKFINGKPAMLKEDWDVFVAGKTVFTIYQKLNFGRLD